MTKLLNIIKENQLIQWIVFQFFPEFKCLFKLAWPIILMNIFRFLNPTISVIMCGHLSKIDFDAAALANAIINVFGISVDLGFSTACDTLFAQVYGSRSKHRLGLMLQRAMLVMTVLYMILICFHLNIEPLFILLSQDVEISRLAAKYVALFLPGLFFDFQFLAISRYLQNQNIVYPMMICSGIGCVFNALGQYIAIYQLGFGIEASAVIQGSTCFVIFSLELVYVIVSKVYVSTWQGIEFWNALEEWGIFFKLGIPGIIMLGVEEWTFEIMIFVAGALGDIQLGALNITFQIAFIFYMMHTGLAISVAIRAGQFLGANKAKEAALTAKTVFISDFMISLCTFTFIMSLRQYIPYVFTDDRDIRLLAENLLFLLAILNFFDAGFNSSCAIFRACGKQKIGAIIMLMSYYFLGVPLGFILVYVFNYDIRGFYFALICAVGVEVFFFLIVIYRIDWNVEAVKAAGRVKESRLSQHAEEDYFESDSEAIKLLKSGEDDTYPKSEINPIIIKAHTHRRPSSNVTDILISSIKEMPNVSPYNRINKFTIMKRSIFCIISFLLFISSLLCKIYLPRGLYIPCIPVGNVSTSLRLDKHYPFCNDTLYDF